LSAIQPFRQRKPRAASKGPLNASQTPKTMVFTRRLTRDRLGFLRCSTTKNLRRDA
jgi:hypothetical protein